MTIKYILCLWMNLMQKKYMLWMTIRSMDAANRVLLRSSIYFIKITAQQAHLPLRPC